MYIFTCILDGVIENPQTKPPNSPNIYTYIQREREKEIKPNVCEVEVLN